MEPSNNNNETHIDSVPKLQQFVKKIQKMSDDSDKKQSTEQLLNIKDKELYDNLIQLNGLSTLSKWMVEIKEHYQAKKELSKTQKKIILNTVKLCEKMKLSINDLKITFMAKNMSNLGKVLKNCDVKSQLENLTNKWRKMKEKELENKEKSSFKNEFLGNKTSRNNFNNFNNNTKLKNKFIKILKSCLKKDKDPQDKPAKKVHFDEDNLVSSKIFILTEMPSAPEPTQEAYKKIQEQVRKDPQHYHRNLEEMRKKEASMDKKCQSNVVKAAEMPFKFPNKLSVTVNLPKTNQSEFISNLCDRVLSVNNAFAAAVEPKFETVKMFAFEDENIPKIENSKEATKTNDVSLQNLLDLLKDDNCSDEVLEKLKEDLEKVEDLDEAIKNKIKSRIDKIEIERNNKNMMNSGNRMFYNNYVGQYPYGQMNYPMNPMVNNPMMNNPMMNNPMINNQMMNNQMINNPMANPMANPMGNNQISNPLPPNNQYSSTYPESSNNPLIDKKMFMESASRMNIQKYKTKPCRNYHSSIGCTRGENCFFIHDPNFKGVDIDNFDPKNYQRNLPIQLPANYQQVNPMQNVNPMMLMMNNSYPMYRNYMGVPMMGNGSPNPNVGQMSPMNNSNNNMMYQYGMNNNIN